MFFSVIRVRTPCETLSVKSLIVSIAALTPAPSPMKSILFVQSISAWSRLVPLILE